MLDRVLHHRLVLNGPRAAVSRLAGDLVASGATPLPGTPPRLVWSTEDAGELAAACAGHRRVIVGAERFAFLGDTLERLVVQGRAVTVLERRPLAADGDDQERRGLCLDPDGHPLPRAALDAAAARVAALPTDLGAGLAGSALDDALLVGAAAGLVCSGATAPVPDDLVPAPVHPLATDPRAAGAPAPAVLGAVAALASAALTAGAACTGPSCSAELAYERAWALTEATAFAALERLWASPGGADWPEWLMDVLAGAAAVVEDCAACLHHPPPDHISVHTERQPTNDERLQESTGRLVATCLQALVLFDA